MPDAVVPFPTVPVVEVQGTLALDLTPRREPPTVTPSAAPGADVVPIDLRRRRQMEAWTARFAQAAVEIVGGDRPVSQLLRWTSEPVYDELRRRATVVGAAGGYVPGQGRVQPVRPRVAGVRTSFVATWTVEAAVRVRYGERSRAVAARFERLSDRRGERWVCTALEWA